jgi:hypothetical protein
LHFAKGLDSRLRGNDRVGDSFTRSFAGYAVNALMLFAGYGDIRECRAGFRFAQSGLQVGRWSQIRRIGRRQRLYVLIEDVEIALGAARLDHRALHAPPAVDHCSG